jgi:hypothetical protein
MPRIPDPYLEGVFYLYNSREDAEKGKACGGTGFLIAMPSATFPSLRMHVYAVTNWHVAVRDGASVIRLNAIGGMCDILEFGPEDWAFLPDYDVAILELNNVTKDRHTTTAMHTNSFLTRERAATLSLGVGDDVFMIGRFIDHDGGPTNRPAARFGNISIMPTKMMQPNNQLAESYCVDVHSRTGYSGSPVYAYRTIGGDLESTNRLTPDFRPVVNWLGFLGIHWGQFPEAWELKEPKPGEIIKRESLDVEGRYVKGMSGMTCVLPAWIISEVLDMPKLKEERRLDDEKEAARLKAQGLPSQPESVRPAADDNPPN